MGRFTYEDVKEENQLLETYEWDNIWWEHAPDTEKKRVLIIGDSITCGYRDVVNQMLCGEIYADGYASSKGIDNPFLIPALDLMIAQSNCSLILFNNGLHGFHLDEEAYKENYLKIVKYLTEKYSEKKVALVLTTPTRREDNPEKLDEEKIEITTARNNVAKEVATELGLDVIDLFEVLIDADWKLWRDVVHLHPPGYEKLATVITEYIKKNI